MAHQGSVVEKTWRYAPVAHPGFQDIFSRQWQTYIAGRIQEAFQFYNTFLSSSRIRSTLGVYTTTGSTGIVGVRRKIRAGVWHAVWTGCDITVCEGRLWSGQGGYPQRAPDKINTSQEVTKTANLYWCTICKDRRPYKKVSAWRKHENEHVNKYVCMLRGPLDEIHGYVMCCLCGMSNPNEEHLSTHNTQICEQRLPGSFSCKRRVDMVKHLKNFHNVPEKAQGEAVAAKWKETTKKQAWSCGFCVDVFYTFGDRL